MKVAELGEFGLIDRLAKMAAESLSRQNSHPGLIIGIGDDTAAWTSDARVQLATVDTMVQDVHFSLDTITWRELGWKSLAINLSDIGAMGGMPDYALVALGLPADTDVHDIDELYRGMLELADRYRVAIVGGNVSRSPVVSITIAVIGSSPEGRILRRSAARPGDIVAVTGYPGSAAAGLATLSGGKAIAPEAASYFRNAFLRPEPRIEEGQLLVESGIAAAIDTSDGLLADLGHICEASRVGARIRADRVPLHPLLKEYNPENAREMTLSGGEDYELLFTGSREAIDLFRAEAGRPVTAIGEITGGSEIEVVDISGRRLDIGKKGWQHF